MDALVRTIAEVLKPGGKILFATIDGRAVKQFLEPNFGKHYSDYTFMPSEDGSRGICKMQLAPFVPGERKRIDNRFELPTVEIQKEYLVMLSDLTTRLIKHGFYLANYFRAQQPREIKATDYFLSPFHEELSQLYAYGYYQRPEEMSPSLMLQNKLQVYSTNSHGVIESKALNDVNF